MNKTVSLNCNGYFLRAYRTGKTVAGRFLVLYFRKNNLNHNRLGITVSKKVGKAVVRNRVRRLIRECYRLGEHHIKSGYDIVFVSRVRGASASYHDIDGELFDQLTKAGLIEEDVV